MPNYTISCIESKNENPTSQSSLFLIEPLEVGHGITLGNALRRTLLSDLSGYAISGFRVNNLTHEFNTLSYLREDSSEIRANLKRIVFRPSGPLGLKEVKKLKAVANIQGPVIVTASMFLLPYPYLSILNPNQYICTVVDKSNLYLEIDIENGKAYKLADETRRENSLKKVEGFQKNTFYVDSLFTPIKNVNYKVKLITDTKGNIKESLSLEIITNGSMSPKRALQESSKLLLELFSPMLLNPLFSSLSEEIFNLENLNEK